VAMLLSLGIVSPLLAQPVLLRSVPAAAESVPAPPQLVLTFNGRVVANLSSVLLVGGPRNTRVLLSLPKGPDADTLVYPLPTLAPGQYRAEWKARAVDGR
jgi:methionine-rich copper-binding protein CopC